jgi:hypothetical protein
VAGDLCIKEAGSQGSCRGLLQALCVVVDWGPGGCRLFLHWYVCNRGFAALCGYNGPRPGCFVGSSDSFFLRPCLRA